MRASQSRSVETIVVTALFLIAGAAGWVFLNQPGVLLRADADSDCKQFGASLLWAMGHGLYGTAEITPKMAEFFTQQRPSLSPEEVPPDLSLFSTSGKFHADRLYLLYSVGILWRLFGISWASVKIFWAAVFAVTGVLTYGLFRLGMNRWLSLAGTALTLASPVMLGQLPWMRSFCKAPFLLAVMLAAGYLLLREIRPRPLLLLSLVTGFVIGIGFGFRQDAVMGLPAMLAIVALGTRVAHRTPGRFRFAAALALVGAFTIPAWPVLRMTRETGGNNAFYMAQGFALESVFDTGAERAMACPFHSNGDYIMHALIADYDTKQDHLPPDDFSSLRALGAARLVTSLQANPLQAMMDLILNAELFNRDQVDIWRKKAELLTRKLVLSLYATFPADVIGRSYAASLRIVRNLQPRNFFKEENGMFRAAEWGAVPLARHLDVFGPWYAAAAFIVIGSLGLWRAAGCLLLFLYFTGYTSIEFQMRHAFHLNFLSFWFPLFLAGAAWAGLRRVMRDGLKQAIAAARPAVPRAAIFTVCAAAFLAGPLYAARFYQEKTIDRLMETYANADLEPLDVEIREDGGKKVFCPARLPAFEHTAIEEWRKNLALDRLGLWPEPNVRTEYLVAEMRTTGPWVRVSWRYRDLPDIMLDSYRLPNPGSPCIFRYYFPVIQYSDRYQDQHSGDGRFGPFKGLTLGPDTELLKFYRVRNVQDFPLLMSVWLPSEQEQMRYCLELGL
mgnify:CR=1 FL=1